MPLGAGACRRLLRSAVVPVIRPARPIPQQIREFEIAISVFDVLRCDPRLDLGHYWPLMNVARECHCEAREQRRPYRRENDLAEGRSAEHTSELQSLMRISYTVFCLKKKNYQQPT